jgi:hypothetical protein
MKYPNAGLNLLAGQILQAFLWVRISRTLKMKCKTFPVIPASAGMTG